MTTTYNEIIHGDSSSGGASSLKTNLINFRKWGTKSANITVHGALTIVNGEATDGTRNAPVLVFESTAVDPRSSSSTDGGKDGLLSGGGNKVNSSDIRCGAIDNTQDRNMYDRSIGCQVRTCRDLKKDEIALSIPRSAMIAPDLIMGSDAGLAIFNCIQQPQPSSEGGGEHEFVDNSSNNYWKSFGNTAKLEKLQAMKIQQNSGTQLLVKILQERKKVETVLNKAQQIAVERRSQQGGSGNLEGDTSKLVQPGVLSYRAPFLAFLIHQRFANEHKPLVVTNNNTNILPEGTPETFAPYARTLPSSICVPICWKRNELALLAGCIPGMPALQKVAARTMQLSSELINLVNAGILYKYPNVFSEGMITWDRWVWAAAVYESRALMTSSLPSWFMDGQVSSPANVWENCGVLIPFLDMLNHEDDAAQTQWHRLASNTNEGGEDNDASMTTTATQAGGRLNIITTRKTRKHEQVYRNYGCLDNEQFMQQFGFTRMSNPADKVRIAWALVNGVGNVDPPTDYEAVSNNDGLSIKQHVFESLDADSVKSWWTEQRISLLGKVTNNDETLESLRKGKKITFCAYNNGKIDPYLLAVAIVATLPPEKVMEVSSLGGNNNNGKPLEGLTLDKTCQNSVRMYLSFLFAKKLGKLLQSLNSCLKDHFNSVQLWTKATKGGLNYVSSDDNNSSTMSSSSVDGGEKSAIMGWQTFFDTYAWYSTMEVEERYYSMAPDSCVLTLYDGHVRSLQNSLDVMTTDALFHANVKQQLVDLGCTLDNTTNANPTPIVKNENAAQAVTQSPAASAVPDKDMDERVTVKSSSNSSKDNEKKAAAQDPSPPKNDKQDNNSKVGEGGTTNKRGDRHKSNKKGDRPPAIKLHIGNLSYKTLPNQLYDFFTKLYGKDSVLECHIPTERDTGNSRGFGFVTMPENDAKRALESGNTHEMDGRILKVAESNSAGGGRGRGGNGGGGRNAPPQNDRCQQCGYRPRWCTCNPNMMPMNHHMGGGGGMGGPPDTIYGPGPYNNNMPLGPPIGPGGGYGYPNEMDGGFGWGGGSSAGGGNDRGGGGGWSRYSRSRSPSYRRSDRDRGYRHRSRSYSYSRSRSRSYSRDRHHRGGRHHDDDRGRRYDDDRRRGSSRRYRSRSRSRSPGRVNEDSVGDQKSGERERSLSRSRSPNKNGDQGGGKRKRDRSRRRRKRSRKDRRSRS